MWLDALTQISGIQGENTTVCAADGSALFPPPAVINLASDPLFVFCHFFILKSSPFCCSYRFLR